MTLGAMAMTLLRAVTAAAARPKVLVQPFAGMGFGGLFGQSHCGNAILEDLNVAPCEEFEVVLDTPVWASGAGQEGMIKFTDNCQNSDLRFEPASMTDFAPQFLDRFEVDDGKLFLGQPADEGYWVDP